MTREVGIRSLAAGGDGVGVLEDGRIVFVPRTAPGDRVEVGDLVFSKRFARGRLLRVVEPSPDRVTPRCAHYERDSCGGCQLQHLGVAAQREGRRRLVGDALRRIGRLDVADPPLEPARSEWEYRAKISLAVQGSMAGYHPYHDPVRVFELRRCEIARPELNAVWAALRASRGLLPSDASKLILRVDRSGGRHVIVRCDGASAWTRAAAMGKALETSGNPCVLWWQPEGGAARAVYGAPEAYPATVFEQVNPTMGDRARARAVELLGNVGGKHVWDLYSGIGETSRALAALGATVQSVEVDRRATGLAEALGPGSGVRRLTGRVEDEIPRLDRPDAVVVNPPRTGLAGPVCDLLIRVAAARLVYVSCDPATLARDLARLVAAYRIREIDAFDLFPQTAHVETVVSLEQR